MRRLSDAWDNLAEQPTIIRYEDTYTIFDLVRRLIQELETKHAGYRLIGLQNNPLTKSIIEILITTSDEELAEILSTNILLVLKQVLIIGMNDPEREFSTMFSSAFASLNGHTPLYRMSLISEHLGISYES